MRRSSGPADRRAPAEPIRSVCQDARVGQGDDGLDDDPGWPGVGAALTFLVPGMARRAARKPGADRLVLLRQTFLAFSVFLVVIGVVLALVDRGGSTVWPWAAAILIVAVGSIVLGRIVEKPLDCS